MPSRSTFGRAHWLGAISARVLLCALTVGLVAPASVAALDGPVRDLPGRWTGWGAVTLGNGTTEQIKCIATYFVENAGGAVKQNLRCASSNYKIDSTASLAVADGIVSGQWEEKTWSAIGSVTGRMTDSGFNLSIQGPNFTAAMAVTMSPCKQTISIAPRGFDVTRIAIGLGKC